jgi:hypothetical protein
MADGFEIKKTAEVLRRGLLQTLSTGAETRRYEKL